MAAVKITINGVICDMYGRTITGPVKIVGEAMYTELGVGGGPMPPGEPVDPGYGVPIERPEHPIYYPPGIWGPPTMPPGYWGGGMGPGVKPQPHPEHPIVIPPTEQPPTGPADGNGFVKPPPAEGGWGYHETYGWLYDPPATGAQPKS